MQLVLHWANQAIKAQHPINHLPSMVSFPQPTIEGQWKCTQALHPYMQLMPAVVLKACCHGMCMATTPSNGSLRTRTGPQSGRITCTHRTALA